MRCSRRYTNIVLFDQTFLIKVWAGPYRLGSSLPPVKRNLVALYPKPTVTTDPPMIPHNRTRKCTNDWWDSVICTEIGSMSYLKKMPGTMLLPVSSGNAFRESVTAYWLVNSTCPRWSMYVVGTYHNYSAKCAIHTPSIIMTHTIDKKYWNTSKSKYHPNCQFHSFEFPPNRHNTCVILQFRHCYRVDW